MPLFLLPDKMFLIMSENIITIFGTSKTKNGEPAFESAYKVGKELAQAGFTIANGGYGGTMLAGAKGVKEAGGEVIGVTCSAFGRSGPNKYITREVKTDCLDERLDKLIELGDSYIVLAGGTGTLLEFAKVWELKNKGFLADEKSIIIIGDFWQPLLDMIACQDEKSKLIVEKVKNPKEAVELLKIRLRD